MIIFHEKFLYHLELGLLAILSELALNKASVSFENFDLTSFVGFWIAVVFVSGLHALVVLEYLNVFMNEIVILGLMDRFL